MPTKNVGFLPTMTKPEIVQDFGLVEIKKPHLWVSSFYELRF